MHRIFRQLTFWCALACLTPPGSAQTNLAPASIDPEGILFFERRIRPLLTEHCYQCHSANAEKIRGGLLLDSREALLKGGESGAVIVPGEPDQSRLIHAIRYSDSALEMPPKKMLSADQILDFETWVRMGAPDPRSGPMAPIATISTNHWAFQPIANPPLPPTIGKKWPKEPIDHFVLAKLEQNGLSPAPTADRNTLMRRVSFALTGLPPTKEELNAFLSDHSPDAFARVVRRLLNSPEFGQRWGRHWLDVARYADSTGLDNNVPFDNAWRYRDYVVRAFNDDKPFDQFIREQIAGDLLPAENDADRYELVTATGFLLLGPKSVQELDQAKLMSDVVDDQIDVTTRAFLGLTVSCARCHDHKFDPISTREYYALAGIFHSTDSLRGPAPGNRRWLEIPLTDSEQVAQFEAYQRQLAELEESIRTAGQMKTVLPGGIDASKLSGITIDNEAAQLRGMWKNSIYSPHFVNKDYIHDANSAKGTMEARFVPNLPKAGNYIVLVAYTSRNNRATNVPVRVELESQTFTMQLNQQHEPTVDHVFHPIGEFQFNAGTNQAVVISNEGTSGFVIVDAVRFVPAEQMTMMAMNRLDNKSGAPFMSPRSYEALERQYLQLRADAPPPLPAAMAVREGSVKNTRLHIRGDHQKLGDEIPRGFLKVVALSDPPEIPRDQSGRLALADWIASESNPLTARVIVNRVWHHLMGSGLVPTVDNFGALGEQPTHPELLDHLAAQFMAEGWSLKRLIERILLSSTYQMSSAENPQAMALDPDNKLLWKMSRRRLEAEAIRDSVLAMSGKLDRSLGGSLLPRANSMAPTLVGFSSTNYNSFRRSIYLPVIRNSLPDFFQVFDFPDPHAIAGKRFVTTSPAQSLYLMNSPFILEHATLWAERLLALDIPDEQRVAESYLQAYARTPSPQETKAVLTFIRHMSTQEALNPVDAWALFCQSLIASAEFQHVN